MIQEQEVPRESRETRDLRDLKAQKVILEQAELREIPVQQVPREIQVHKVQLVPVVEGLR